MTYKDDISELMNKIPFEVNTEAEIRVRKPTNATSNFLTNKEQGDWAEQVVLNAINEKSDEYRAIKYGRDDSLSAGDPGFDEFFNNYVYELNSIGKKPDILVYRADQVPKEIDLDDYKIVRQAIVALEVRSSSFLINEYTKFMTERTQNAERSISDIVDTLLSEPYSSLLKEKKPHIHHLITTAKMESFKELNFRQPNYQSTPQLLEMTNLLRLLKSHMKTLSKRDYLSITPKVEDLVLVNR